MISVETLTPAQYLAFAFLLGSNVVYYNSLSYQLVLNNLSTSELEEYIDIKEVLWAFNPLSESFL